MWFIWWIAEYVECNAWVKHLNTFVTGQVNTKIVLKKIDTRNGFAMHVKKSIGRKDKTKE